MLSIAIWNKNMNDQGDNYTHFNDDNEDVQFAEHHVGHNIGPSDDPDVYSLILPPNRCTKRCLNTCDVCLSLVVISPLVIIHWRGTWAIMDENMEYFPPMNCFLFGMIFHFVIAMIREFLYSEYKKTKTQKRTWTRVMCRSLLTKLYAYLFSWTCQMHWRGGWAVVDQYFGKFYWTAFCNFVFHKILQLQLQVLDGIKDYSRCCFVCFSCSALKVCGTLWHRNKLNQKSFFMHSITWTFIYRPILILTDTKEFAFGFPTRYRTEVCLLIICKSETYSGKSYHRFNNVTDKFQKL